MTRPAKIEDAKEIINLQQALILDVHALSHHSYRVQIQQEGFLIKNHLLTETIDQALIQRYFVHEQDGHIVGYIRIDETAEMTDDSDAYWLEPSIKKQYYVLPHANISRLAVRPDVRKHGIAKAMLELAEKQAKKRGVKYLFSFVVLSPVTNTVSLLFHERSGFERAAITFPRPLFGMQGYQSILYYKELK